MFCLAVISCLLAAALAGPFSAELDSEWGAYKVTYNKNYLTEIEPLRRTIWEKNVHKVRQHNLEADRGLHTYRLGMNEYGDLTSEEFVTQILGLKHNQSNSEICKQYQTPLNVELSDLPSEVDWRKKGYVTEVKNQGQCGSCWAFSATGSLEGQHFRKCGKLVSLSEQNLADCSNKYGNLGCQGGTMDQAFEYIIKNRGIDTEQSYPYRAKDGKCHFKRKGVGATMTSCRDIKSKSEADLQKAVATVGPISVAIDAGHLSFQLYRSGVYTETECSQTSLDHGVLAVGYGCEGGKDYWLVKNSWGTSWGMKGYIMMARNHNNMCGIATMASFPVV